MWTLKTKNGFSMVEVIISIGLFICILTLCSYISLNIIKLKQWNDKKSECEIFLREIKNDIKNGMSYTDINSLDSMTFINNNSLSFDKLKNENINTLLQSSNDGSYPYAKITITKEDQISSIIKVDIIVCFKSMGREGEESCTFYKGNYMVSP